MAKPGVKGIVEAKGISVSYELIDDSFSHEYGTEKKTGYKITEVQIYIEALDTWFLDLDLNNENDKQKEVLEHARFLVEQDMAK